MINLINQSDKIILNSVESYMINNRLTIPTNPQERLYFYQYTRDLFYSDIAERVPRVAAYILQNDIETNDEAKGLYIALCNHAKDPVFISILMQSLAKRNIAEENGVVGALLTKIMNKILEDKKVTSKKPVMVDKKSDKDKSTAPKQEENSGNNDDVKHLYEAIKCLLGDTASIIATQCGNITMTEALAVAACINMNNADTIKEIIECNLPISAQLFNILSDQSNLLAAALRLNAADYTKLTQNQSNFIETLKRWVYEKLDMLPTPTAMQFINASYGSTKPDVSTKLIQLKDCGTQFSNLLLVAKQIIN